jgi:hypothetical protein
MIRHQIIDISGANLTLFNLFLIALPLNLGSEKGDEDRSVTIESHDDLFRKNNMNKL